MRELFDLIFGVYQGVTILFVLAVTVGTIIQVLLSRPTWVPFYDHIVCLYVLTLLANALAYLLGEALLLSFTLTDWAVLALVIAGMRLIQPIHQWARRMDEKGQIRYNAKQPKEKVLFKPCESPIKR